MNNNASITPTYEILLIYDSSVERSSTSVYKDRDHNSQIYRLCPRGATVQHSTDLSEMNKLGCFIACVIGLVLCASGEINDTVSLFAVTDKHLCFFFLYSLLFFLLFLFYLFFFI